MIELIAIVLVVLVVMFLGMVILYYNSLVTQRNRVDKSWSDIDVQLKKRYDLIPNLVETVKGYARYEKSVFENVTKARAMVANAGGVAEKAKADNMLTGALKSLFAVAENYPSLKANENFKMLQEELSGIESKIAYSRNAYNEFVLEFNTTQDKFPSSIVASLFAFKKRDHFAVENAAERGPVKVKFD